MSEIEHMEEPIVKADIYSPPDYLGQIMDLCREKRGVFLQMTYLDKSRVRLEYNLPLNEIIFDFFDQIKSRTRGYASFDYELIGYERSKLVKSGSNNNDASFNCNFKIASFKSLNLLPSNG